MTNESDKEVSSSIHIINYPWRNGQFRSTFFFLKRQAGRTKGRQKKSHKQPSTDPHSRRTSTWKSSETSFGGSQFSPRIWEEVESGYCTSDRGGENSKAVLLGDGLRENAFLWARKRERGGVSKPCSKLLPAGRGLLPSPSFLPLPQLSF